MGDFNCMEAGCCKIKNIEKGHRLKKNYAEQRIFQKNYKFGCLNWIEMTSSSLNCLS